jgi:hypothetical protein
MSMENFQRKFFIITFALVLIEETLRLISYGSGNSPYVEANIYVAIASLWLSPYISSSIIFLSACLILFATRRLARGQTTDLEFKNLLKKTVPIGVFTSIAIISIFSIANWMIILLI